MLNKFEQSIVDRLRYGTHNNKPVTLGADEVHIPMNAIEERDKYRALGTVEDFQRLVAAQNKSKAHYRFVTEFMAYPSEQEETEDNTASICLIQCEKCGWYMFGDGWWESEVGNCTNAEQIPTHCAHCGAEFVDEEAESAPAKEGEGK